MMENHAYKVFGSHKPLQHCMTRVAADISLHGQAHLNDPSGGKIIGTYLQYN